MSETTEPTCPICDGVLVRRSGTRGEFWGCLRYPECPGTVEIEKKVVASVSERKQDVPLEELHRAVLQELRARRVLSEEFTRLKLEDLPSSMDYVGRQLERVGDILHDMLKVLNAVTVLVGNDIRQALKKEQ